MENIIYSDVDNEFGLNPFTNDVLKKTNKESIKQSIRNILRTEHYDRLYHPEIGSFLHNLIFSPLDLVTVNKLKSDLYDTLTMYEPRITIKLVDVVVTSEKVVKIAIGYEINMTSEQDVYVYTVDRT